MAVTAVTAWWMYDRVQAEQLWGYAPLVLYTSLYVGIWLLATFRPGGATPTNNYLSAASGLLLGVGFPGLVPFPFLLLAAFVPLLWLRQRLAAEGAGYGKVFRHGFSAFVLYNLLATYWVTNTGFFAGLFAVVVNSCLMCLPWLFYYWMAKHRKPGLAYIGFGSAWLAFEVLHHNWSLNWPWLTLGNGFMQFPELVQWYEWTGVFGGTIWILAVNYLLFGWLPLLFTADCAQGNPRFAPPYAYKHLRPRNYLPVLLLISLPLVWSVVRYATYAPPAGESVSVASIQPNFEPHFEKFSGNQSAQLDTFLRLSQAALAEGPVDYLVYPETSFGSINEDDVTEAQVIEALIDQLRGKAAYLITGIDAYHLFRPGEALSEAVRYLNRGKRGKIAFEALNAAAQIPLHDRQDSVQTYRKGVFVPGAESFPFRKVLFFLEPLVNSLGGTVAGRGTSPYRKSFVGENARIAPVICYESVFGEYFTGYVREGAQAAFVVTNDGWWDNTAGHRQHLWMSSLRAIETRRAVVRSANVGACAFIDQRGKILSRTKYDRAGYLRGLIQLNDEQTLYVRFSDLLTNVNFLLFAILFLGTVTASFLPKKT